MNLGALVALRKESVDRNMLFLSFRAAVGSSLSARRAWIEIVNTADQEARKRSLSARRAWIEMGWRLTACLMMYGSLSARRAWIEIDIPPNLDADRARRSPQGERG